MNKARFIAILILAGTGTMLPVSGQQEVLVPAGPAHRSFKIIRGTRLKSGLADTLELPVFDDFSSRKVWPDPELWADRMAYVNNTYPSDPVTIGVATLDALDEEGELNGTTEEPFDSDHLTSLPINLHYPERDDIVLSFYFQPAGLGDVPEPEDSLCVDFYAPRQGKWHTVWNTPGDSLRPFKEAFIAVTDTIYLHKGFRFRFRNYASLLKSQSFPDKRTNQDHWHIDYVLLDTLRETGRTIKNDVAQVASLGSILKNHESIPWNHFPRAFLTELKPRIEITYRNLDTITRNVTRMLRITDLNVGNTYTVDGKSVNIGQDSTQTYVFDFNYPFIFYEAESASFKISAWLITDEKDYHWNDTVNYIQKFGNYYAYDDGSPESGYGLRGEGTINARVACQFETFRRDTLRAVNMLFLRTVDDVSRDYFTLAVWDHQEELNQPGNLIYRMEGMRPEYPDSLNQMVTYRLDSAIEVSGIFYVGWIKTTENMLNVGFDRNNNHRPRIFYNLGQEWKNTSYKGSLLIRPVVGEPLGSPAGMASTAQPAVRVFPNPTSGHLRLEISGRHNRPEVLEAAVYSATGQLMIQTRLEGNVLDISTLPGGIYFLRLTGRDSFRSVHRIVLIHQ